MGLTDCLIITLLVVILGFAAFFVCRSKKRRRCIGCPDGCNCNGNCTCCKGQICEK